MALTHNLERLQRGWAAVKVDKATHPDLMAVMVAPVEVLVLILLPVLQQAVQLPQAKAIMVVQPLMHWLILQLDPAAVAPVLSELALVIHLL
jgi:hypothetical protein